MMASRIFNDVLNTVQSSNLNFCLQISPFAANISLKKSFLKDKSGNVLVPDQAYTTTSYDENIAAVVSKNLILEKENSTLRKDLENSVNEYQEVFKQLKSLKVMEKELLEEIRVLRGIKQEKNELENHEVKELEEEIKVLQTRVDERDAEIESLKHATEVAREISNKVHKELSDTKLKFREEKATIFKEHKAEVKAWKKDLGEANKEKIKLQNKFNKKVANFATMTTTPPVSAPSSFEPEVVCSICADPIIGYKPKYFLGEAFNPACSKCDDSFEGDNTGPDPEGCKHTPVCVIRQPLPPPSPALKYLVNEQSKYHEHMMSLQGVPGRYGGCDRCMEAYSKNYGCNDCVWLKWHGDLHGYPDLHPSDFRKYLEPSEWSIISTLPFGF